MYKRILVAGGCGGIGRAVVGPILFLPGPGSAYMTGQVLYVNGGMITP